MSNTQLPFLVMLVHAIEISIFIKQNKLLKYKVLTIFIFIKLISSKIVIGKQNIMIFYFSS